MRAAALASLALAGVLSMSAGAVAQPAVPAGAAPSAGPAATSGGGAASGGGATATASVGRGSCRGTVYLTLDTGNMRHAEPIAAILAKHGVRATFFLADEPTPRGDTALDPAWAGYWRARAAEGHAFGSHTWRHGRFLGDADGRVRYRPQFGEDAGRTLSLDARGVCTEIERVDARFREFTGRGLDRFWRAPGGRTTPGTLAAAGRCGWSHAHWSPAGFLGDELPSESHPNDALLARALAGVRDGDVLMAHLGIWSRKDPYAPMLDPLITGLKARGLCFATLPEAASAGRLPTPIMPATGAASPTPAAPR